VQHQPDVSVGAWIRPRLADLDGTVGCVVPAGYAAYARILHPLGDGITWAEVCARTGAVPHALVQWHSIGRGRDPHDGPEEGDLRSPAREALLALLPASDVTFGLWEGFGWIDGGWQQAGWRSWSAGDEPLPEPVRLPSAFAPEIMDGPRLRLPQRAHILFSGPSGAWPHVCSPTLTWPQDRSWFVGTEVDLDSTLVAGSAELIGRILASPDFESWSVGLGDSLGWMSDTINGPSPERT
jgi:hypothetical protein